MDGCKIKWLTAKRGEGLRRSASREADPLLDDRHDAIEKVARAPAAVPYRAAWDFIRPQLSSFGIRFNTVCAIECGPPLLRKISAGSDMA
jgi:hypothetical protein